MKYLPNSETCFVCGENNHAGLSVRFFVEDGKVKAVWQPRPHHCGYENTLHGGVIASLLDETLAWVSSRFLGRMCVTGELTVRYFRRTPGDRELFVTGEITEPGRRRVCAKGIITDAEGTEYAEAHGRFVPMSVEETLAVDDGLLYRPGDEQPFIHLRTDNPHPTQPEHV